MSVLSPLADACPKCHPGDYPAVLPLGEPQRDGGSLKACYRHGACGFEWACWWDPKAAGWPLHREESAA